MERGGGGNVTRASPSGAKVWPNLVCLLHGWSVCPLGKPRQGAVLGRVPNIAHGRRMEPQWQHLPRGSLAAGLGATAGCPLDAPGGSTGPDAGFLEAVDRSHSGRELKLAGGAKRLHPGAKPIS